MTTLPLAATSKLGCVNVGYADALAAGTDERIAIDHPLYRTES